MNNAPATGRLPYLDTSGTPQTAQDVRDSYKPNAWLDQQPPYHNPKVEVAYDAMVAKLGLDPKPVLIMATLENSAQVGVAQAKLTQEGRPYIIVGNIPMNDADLTAMLAHELGHIAKGHGQPEKLATIANKDDIANHAAQKKLVKATTNGQVVEAVRESNPNSKAVEREADGVAVSVCEARAAADYFQRILDASRFNLPANMRQAGMSTDQSLEIADPYHPALPTRIQALRQGAQAAEANGTCPAPKPSGHSR